MPSDELRTAGRLLARRTLRNLGLVMLALIGIYAAVTREPLSVSFLTGLAEYLGGVLTADVGRVTQIHRAEWVDIATWNVYIPDRSVTAILAHRLPSTAFVFVWTILLGVVGGIGIGVLWDHVSDRPSPPDTSTIAVFLRVLPVYVVGELLVTLLNFSDRLFNFDYETLLVDSTPIVFGLRTFPNLLDVEGLFVASKWAIVPALAASTVLVPTTARLTRVALTHGRTSAAVDRLRQLGGNAASHDQERHTLVLWGLETLPAILVVVPTATLIAEVAVRNDTGLSRVAGAALLAGEPGLLAALFVLIVGPALLADIVREPAMYLLTGTHRSAPRSQDRFSLPAATVTIPEIGTTVQRLRPLFPPHGSGVIETLRSNPRPAATWTIVAVALIAVELGAIFDVLAGMTGATNIPRLPTLISWSTIPDAAYPTSTGTAGSFLGLPQWAAWALRVFTAELYLIVLLGWAWLGIRIARVIYGDVTTPLVGGPVVTALRSDRRLLIGGTVVLLVVAVGIFAPATATGMADNPTAEFSGQVVTFRDPATGEIHTIRRIIVAGTQRPTGVENGTAGPMEYGRFDRFHPMGILYDPQPALTGGITRDAFLPFVMRLQQLLFTVGLVVGAAGLFTVVFVILAAATDRLETLLTGAAGALVLLSLPVALGATRRMLTGSFKRVGTTPSLPPSPVDQATTWLDQSLLATHHIALAGLMTAVLLLIAHRYLHPDTGQPPADPWAALRVTGLPLLAGMFYLAGGAMIVILVERIFLEIDPTAQIFFDVGVSMDFVWIDTALWYRNTLPVGCQVLLAGSLAVVGDGIRSVAHTRVDPTSHGPTETDGGGDGV